MPILLGALSSLLIGISDTLGRSVTRRLNSISLVGTAMLAGVATAALWSLALGSEAIAGDIGRGALSGVLLSLALAVMYRGMAESSSAITSPIAAVGTALLPLFFDLARGASLSTLSTVGCVVAVVSLLLTTFNPRLVGDIRKGVLLGVLAGVLAGGALIAIGETAEASGAWPAVSQRTVGFATMALLAARASVPTLVTGRLLPLAVLSGVAGTTGMVAFVFGAQRGDLGVVSVAASMVPAVVVFLSKMFDDDDIRWWQGLGIASAILGLALIALGNG